MAMPPTMVVVMPRDHVVVVSVSNHLGGVVIVVTASVEAAVVMCGPTAAGVGRVVAIGSVPIMSMVAVRVANIDMDTAGSIVDSLSIGCWGRTKCEPKRCGNNCE